MEYEVGYRIEASSVKNFKGLEYITYYHKFPTKETILKNIKDSSNMYDDIEVKVFLLELRSIVESLNWPEASSITSGHINFGIKGNYDIFIETIEFAD